jgi:hypothetical protein
MTYKNNYQLALEAAGATVHEFKEFGSYQGDWWAKVTFEGRTGLVNGAFGSSSHCDSFQSEFGHDAEGQYTTKELATFGMKYLENIKTQDQALAIASENIEWDLDAEETVKFILDNTVAEEA